jgi:protein-tyrosine-phosphatase
MKQELTDIHQHLLWGIDDGADSREIMYSMLREAQRQGIKTIIATSHARPGLQPFDMGLYTERLTEAQCFCKTEDLGICVLPGAEIAWTHQTPLALRQGKIPTMGGTDYVLLELWRNISWQAAQDAVKQLTRAGYCPVLAHPERYLAFIRSPKKTLQFRNETGALLQLNADTVLSPRNYWERRFTEYLLKEGAVDAIASDAHDCINRPVNMEAAYQWLTIHTDAAYAKELVTFGGELT